MGTLLTRNRITIPALGVALLFALIMHSLDAGYRPAFASGDPARSAVGSDLVIEKGEVVLGDVSVTGGDLTIRGEVRGDAIVVGGNLAVGGTVTGKIFVVGGSVTLRALSFVGGEVDYSGGELTREAGARVGGAINQTGLPSFGLENSAAGGLVGPPNGVSQFWRTPFEHLGTLFGWGIVSLIVLLISVVLAIVAPLRVRVASATLVSEGRPALTLGLIIAAMLGPLTGAVIAVLMVTVVGWVLIPVVAALLVVALASGLAIMGVWLGRTISQNTHHDDIQRPTPMLVQMLLGMAAILCSTVVPAALVPVGWIATTLIVLLYVAGCIGLGSILLSRLGTLPPARSQNRQPASPVAHSPGNTMPLGSAPPTSSLGIEN